MKQYLKTFFLRPILAHKGWAVAAIASLLLLSAAQSLFVALVGPFLKAIFAEPGTTIRVSAMLPDHAPFASAFQDIVIPLDTLLIALPIAISIAGIAKALGSFLFQYSQEALATFVSQHYREELFDLIVRQPFARFRTKGVGQWMSEIMNDVSVIQSRFSDVTTSFIRDVVLALAGLVAIYVINWRAGLIMTAVAPVIGFFLGRAAVRIAWFTEQFQRRLAETAGAFLDLRARFNLIRAQHGEEIEFRRFDGILRAYYRMIRRSLPLRSMMGPGMEFFGFFIFAAFLWHLINKGEQDAQTAALARDGVQLVAALGLMLRPMRNIGEQLTKLQEIRGALRAGFETWNEVRRFALNAPDYDSKISLESGTRIEKQLAIQHIAVKYGSKPSLDVTDITFERGKSYAVIGPSGAGKSTLLKVLAGLVEPEVWHATNSLETTRRNVAFVSQEPFFFQASLRENLLYGIPREQWPDEKTILASLALFNIEAEIMSPGVGLDADYKGIGGNLSGGQLQRMVLARETLRKKGLLLLDEPTSAIDSKSEREISERLVSLMKDTGSTLIMVTHRLQWLSLFDWILFLENGVLLAQGTFDEVVKVPRVQSFCQDASVTP